MKSVLADLVGGLTPEELPQKHPFSVNKGLLHNLLNEYEEYVKHYDTFHMERFVILGNYSAEDLATFCLKTNGEAVKPYWSSFLLRHIRRCPDNNIVLHAPDFGNHFFSHNGVHIKGYLELRGNLGNGSFDRVSCDNVQIYGNVGREFGSELSGNVTIHGNVGSHAVHKMKSGTFTVKGIAEGQLGNMAASGEINIKTYAGTSCGELAQKNVRFNIENAVFGKIQAWKTDATYFVNGKEVEVERE